MRAFIALLFVAVATAAPLLKNTEPIPGQYIIKLNDKFDVDAIAATVRLSGGRVRSIFRHALHGFAAELSDKVLDVVLSLPSVEYVEQDGVYRTQAVTWGLDRVDQRSLPLDGSFSPRNDGSGFTAYVLDTGVRDTHVEFGDRATQAVSYANGGNTDCNGHGTHCSGTIGSVTYGVAKGINIVGVKVLGCFGSGSTSGIVDGCDYVIAQGGGRNSVASMSLGGGASISLDRAVANMVSNGIPTAVAAGNSNTDAGSTSPAREPSAITVGASDNADRRSSFSSYGSVLDIYAPGTDITSTWNSGDSSTNTISGTSMACPHVAGGIAVFGGNTANMLSATSNNKLSDVGSGSPNQLLYVGN